MPKLQIHCPDAASKWKTVSPLDGLAAAAAAAPGTTSSSAKIRGAAAALALVTAAPPSAPVSLSGMVCGAWNGLAGNAGRKKPRNAFTSAPWETKSAPAAGANRPVMVVK